MPVRLRRFIGVILFLVTLFLYVMLAVQIEHILPTDSNIGLQVVIYALAGVLWVIPAGLVILWMSKPASIEDNGKQTG